MHTTTALSTSTIKPVAIEKPQNGIAGLKHWRQDILAGLVVSLISLPFSLGIAVASGCDGHDGHAQPIVGIISAIIAGFVLPFLGGSYVTVSGPAAGLAPILLASMMVLGKGNLGQGYPLLLVAICFAGVLQLVLARFKFARLCAIFPAAVVEGMLCAIGLLIIVKQFPALMGVKFHAHEFYEYVLEVPSHLAEAKPTVFIIGVLSLALMFALSAGKAKWLKVLPPQVLAVIFGSTLGLVFGLKSDALINIPANPLSHGFTLPDFQEAWNNTSVWMGITTTVITLTLIDGIESLATVMAIDKIDPFHRKSDPNRTLSAMGVSNIVSSIAGGLTIIPGGVKSTACIMAGGRTQWANFYNACFLLVYLLLARPVINLMPYSVLAAMLIFTGYKLCRPKVWKHVAHIGGEQLFVFTVTVIATLTTDLLWGIITGIVTKWLLACWLTSTAHVPAVSHSHDAGMAMNGRQPFSVWRWLQTLRNPVAHRESIDDAHHIYFDGPLVCFNLLHVNGELARTPATAKRIFLHVTDRVPLVDHTSCERLLHFVEECDRNGTAHVEVIGLDRMSPRSAFPSCMRTRTRHCNPAESGHPKSSDGNSKGNQFRKESAVVCATAAAATARPDDGMAWISLSDPAVTADEEADAQAEQELDRTAQAQADMDWLDLSRASGERRPLPDRKDQARADMDWLDLERSGDEDATGPAGGLAPI
jgi:MFS superfamily sulfate permease-like transporter